MAHPKKKQEVKVAPRSSGVTRTHISFRVSDDVASMLDKMAEKAAEELGVTVPRTAIIERSIRESADKRGIKA
jgi:predicted transcriptional regulator